MIETFIGQPGTRFNICEATLDRSDAVQLSQQYKDIVFTVVTFGQDYKKYPLLRKELLLGAARPELLDRVAADLDLSDLLDRHPSTLSGGQKQRVAIGAAILADRRLVILDEPTSGLDLCHMNQVSQAIRTMHERGSMVLVISHDEEFLQQTCHRFLTLRGGRVAADRERLDSLIASL